MVYSPKRILTPLKRVDFDPKGERNMQNRGVSGYEPISWDEALDIVTEEIVRAASVSGPGAILTTPELPSPVGQHRLPPQRLLPLHEPGGLHLRRAQPRQLGGLALGRHAMWGNSHRLGIPEQYDLLEDALKHTEMVVFWSADPESTGGGIYSAFESTPRRYWMKELGVKMVFVDPYFNHTAELFGTSGSRRVSAPTWPLAWPSPTPGSPRNLRQGIRRKRTTGFDEWKDYVLGKTDNVPKTPDWAETECGIPAREIRALAREWGAKKTMLAAGGLGGWGGACRSATGNEWARTMIALAAMQGYGKPGSNIWATSQGAPCDESFVFPGYAEGGISGDPDKSAAAIAALPHVPARRGLHPTVNPHDSTEGMRSRGCASPRP